MKKTLSLVAVPLILASCGFNSEAPKTETTSPAPTVSSGSSSSGAVIAMKKDVVSAGDTVSVDYVGRLEDGSIFDSSLEEFAKQKKGYTPGRTFEPLSFTVGAGQMIKGFDG